MSIDERELRSRLAETAELAGPPRFTAPGLVTHVRRIRRRRVRNTGIAAVSAVALASAVAIPLTVAGPSGGGTYAAREGVPASLPVRLSYTVTADGQTQADGRATGTVPLFTITPAEKLTMTVKVTVPRRQLVTSLRLGIINGELGGQGGMSPVLAFWHLPLRPGVHRFVLHWTVPPGLKSGTTRQLGAAWVAAGSGGAAETSVADFAIPLPAASRATVERRIRAAITHDLTNCDGTKPASILAVRTTFRRVMAIPELAQGDNITEKASGAVYVVVMSGHFTPFTDSGKPTLGACSRTPPASHQVEAVFDAATFVELEEGFAGNYPYSIPLQSLGRVLNVPVG